MKQQKADDEVMSAILRQLEVTNALLGLLMTEKDFSGLSQAKQIVRAQRRGLRNKELTLVFGVKKQQISNALRKGKRN